MANGKKTEIMIPTQNGTVVEADYQNRIRAFKQAKDAASKAISRQGKRMGIVRMVPKALGMQSFMRRILKMQPEQTLADLKKSSEGLQEAMKGFATVAQKNNETVDALLELVSTAEKEGWTVEEFQRTFAKQLGTSEGSINTKDGPIPIFNFVTQVLQSMGQEEKERSAWMAHLGNTAQELRTANNVIMALTAASASQLGIVQREHLRFDVLAPTLRMAQEAAQVLGTSMIATKDADAVVKETLEDAVKVSSAMLRFAEMQREHTLHGRIEEIKQFNNSVCSMLASELGADNLIVKKMEEDHEKRFSLTDGGKAALPAGEKKP